VSSVPPASGPRPSQELVQLAIAGDLAATSSLLHALSPEMQRVIRGVLGPAAAEVDDALQQSLVGLVRALPAFRGDCSLAGYACRIAFRTAISTRRGVRRRSKGQDHETDMAELAAPQGSDPMARARTEMVRTLLLEIPTEQAEALAMRTMLGWSLEEIAEASEAPVNTIRSRLRLAKEAMRKRIMADPQLVDWLGGNT
jgi:RNA polymerase sigma factor (sigma-70 family)